MVFEKMLVGYTALDNPDALLLRKLSNKNMEIRNLLVRSRKTMVYNQMDLFRVPDLLNTHLAEDLDRQRAGAILGHSHVGRQNSNLARKADLPASLRFDANDLLGKSKRVIAKNRPRQANREAEQKLPLLKMKLKRPQYILVVVESEKMSREVFKLAGA
jgi:hypothetical protein